ncbi:Monopolin complex subunit [Lachnellula subtilissima]|uniref:Monopolin complex subunit n=1 Tax=Lachnellula subtilissima TaxID=602034 RepID=A0A8H8U778_9HELO|nr:Monopolin complex subunit [Lachnellula subtilissima]
MEATLLCRKRKYQNKQHPRFLEIVAIPASTPPQHPSTDSARDSSNEISRTITRLPPNLLSNHLNATCRATPSFPRKRILIIEMSKAKSKHATLSGLIDSDSEDDFIARDAMPTPDSAVENKTAAKKARGRPKAAPAKVTKTKAPARRISGRLTAKAPARAPKKDKRQVLADRTNQQNAEDTEEVDEFAQEDEVMQDDGVENTPIAVKQTKPKATQKKAAKGRPKTVKEVSSTDYSIEASEAPKPEPKKAGRKRGPAKKEIVPEPSPEKVIPETQAPVMDIDNDAEEEIEQTITKSAPNVRSDSRVRHPSVQRRQAGSASDTERDRGDPILRRKLGEMTKKYENLHIKYQDLKEIGLKESERNFERLRKQTDEKTKISNNLIASLKADLEKQSIFGKDSKGLKKKVDIQSDEIASLKTQIAQLNTSVAEIKLEGKTLSAEKKTLATENKNLSSENKKLLTENSKLSTDVKSMTAENKTLSAKLAANRTVAASVESANSRVPGSAVKPNGGIRLMGTVEAAQVAQAAQLKEDLYSDLTGLIIRGVKRETEEDIFDCIQTGRNGTLHFKLAAANEKTADSYEDAQCNYIPQLDPSRDKDLMDLLPDYLVDEITFPRPQAAKFYARVGKALTEKPS